MLHEAYDCRLIFSALYHPQTNGLVESAHKALKRALIKSLDEKKENWVHFLEEITFSLNIRPRGTTNFSAFELVHGSRKPRLPTEAEDLALLYPDVIIAASDDDKGVNETELVEHMQIAQENQQIVAGECLTRSEVMINNQYDKKINPIHFENLKEADEVLIENVYQSRKGGKFQDKWLGLYPIAQVNPKTVRVYRNKSIQRVKLSKVKLWKKPATTMLPNDKITTILPRHSPEIKDDFEDLLSEEPDVNDQLLPIGAEETVYETLHPHRLSRESMLNQLNSMRSQIVNSIRTTTPLSELHRELHKRRDKSFRDLFDWRTDHYPSTNTAVRQDDQLETLMKCLTCWLNGT